MSCYLFRSIPSNQGISATRLLTTIAGGLAVVGVPLFFGLAAETKAGPLSGGLGICTYTGGQSCMTKSMCDGMPNGVWTMGGCPGNGKPTE
jgi:hypothetical protein